MRLLLISVMLLSTGCMTRSQVKKMVDDAIKNQPVRETEVRPNTSDFLTMDDLNRVLDIHKNSYPHGCDCK